METQKFKRGDVVHIAKNLGSMMSHFENDIDAIILGSYQDQYGGNNVNDFTVMFIENGNECSWYESDQLTFIRHGGENEIQTIKSEREKRNAVQSDINWIVENWPNIRKNPSGATMGKLMKLVGITNPWGSNGEGVTYFANMQAAYTIFDGIFSSGNREMINKTLKELSKND